MPQPRSRFARRLLALFAGLVLALIAGEVALRIVARIAGRPHDSDAERAALLRVVAGEQEYSPTFRGALPALSNGKQEGPVGPEAQMLRLLHPFTGWETEPEMELTARLAREHVAPNDPHAFRIVLLGGSVAAIFARLGKDRLIERLAADPKLAGRTPELLCFARTGGKQPQQLMTIAWLFTLGIVPDAVVDLDGHNEVSVGAENAERGTNPLYPSIPHWGALALVGGLDQDVIRIAARTLELRDQIKSRASTALSLGAYRSELASTLVRRSLAPLQAEQARLHETFFQALKSSEKSGVLRGPPFDPDPEHVIAQSVDGWESDSQMTDELCRARGVVYVHCLQPALYDPAGKAPTARELDSAKVLDVWKHGVQVGYPLLRAAGARLAARGVKFVDLSNVFVGMEGDVFVDSCHFDEHGNAIVADRIAQELLAVLR